MLKNAKTSGFGHVGFWKHDRRPARGPFILPDCPGVYVLYWHGELIYVGSTVSVLNRLEDHRTEGLIRFDRVKYKLTRKMGDWAMIEVRLIARLRPRLNIKTCEYTERMRFEHKHRPRIGRIYATRREGARG